MSKHGNPVELAIEWSPKGVLACEQGHTRAYPAGSALPYGGREALVTVSRRSVFVRKTRVPNASPEEIRTILTMQAEELFPLGVQDLAIDFQLTDDVSPEGRLAIAVAMPTSELRKLKEEVTGVGIKIRQILPVAFGSVLVAQELHMTDAAVVEETVDGLSIDLITDGHLVYSRSAPVGSPIDLEVSRTCAAAGIGCLPVVTVGVTDYPEAAVVSQTTALTALQKANHLERFVTLEEREVIAARKKALYERRMLWSGMSLIVAFAFAARVFLDFQSDASVVKAQTARYSANLKRDQAIRKENETKTNTLTAVEKQLKIAFEPAQSLTDMVTVLTNKAPEGIWLTGMTVERGKQLSVRGTGRNGDLVNTYWKNLSAEPRFRDVRLVFANNGTIDTQQVVQFSITLFPNGNVPIVDPNAKKATKK